MIKAIQMSSEKEVLTVIIITTLSLLLITVCIGFRSEHLPMVALYLVLSFTGLPIRKLAVVLPSFAIFGISYDRMRICPDYEANPTDVAGLYSLEKLLSRVMDNGVLIIPCEYSAVHHWAVTGAFAGIFYLCWIPVPILFGLCLYFKKRRETYLRFALVFLFVSLVSFVGYCIHPAAPPQYTTNYSSGPILNTPGDVAGPGRFNEIFGATTFDSIYGRDVNVLTAIPSLHATYMVTALVYTTIGKCRWYVVAFFSATMAGIWGTTIHSCYHHIINVLLRISYALLGWLLLECGLMKVRGFGNLSD